MAHATITLRRATAISTFLLLLIAMARADGPATSQADRWDREQYFVAYLNGQRVGYLAERERSLPDGGLESFQGMKLSVAAGGQAIHIVVTDRGVESAAGRPLSFNSYRLIGLLPIQREGVIRDGQLEITSVQDKQRFSRKQRWDGRVAFAGATRRTLQDKLKADGDSATIWTHNSDDPGEGFSPTTFKRTGEEEIKVNGRATRAVKVAESNPNWPGEAASWYDREFRLVAGEIALGPRMQIKLEACSKPFAHQRFEASEVLADSLIKLAGPVKDVQKITSLTLTLKFAKPLDEPIQLPQSGRQRVAASTVRELAVELRRPAYPKPPAGAQPELGQDVKQYLESSELFNLDDPEIVKAARQAVGERTDPLAKAKAIRDWVDDRLAFKEFGVASGTASEVLRSQRGDCTEHAALLVALARAAGLPARSVCGLVYAPDFGGSKDVLGGHEWAQVYVHGQWVDFDAAIPGDPAHVLRVALAINPPDGKSDSNALSGIYKMFGNVASAEVSGIER